MEAVKSKSR